MTDKTTGWPDGITPETLMAYADGKLPAEQAALIAEQVEANPELQAEVDAYLDSRAALEGRYDDVLDEPVPTHLATLVLEGTGNVPDEMPTSAEKVVSFEHAREQRSLLRLTQTGWGQAIAACAMLAIGAFFGAAILSGGPERPGPSLVYAGLLDPDHPLTAALETTPSATTISSGEGRFRSLQSFQTTAGSFCREYEVSENRRGITAIACRGNAGWQVELLVAGEVHLGDTSAGYRPASGFDAAAIEEALEVMGAQPGFSADREACLLDSGWNRAVCENTSERPE